MTEQFDEVVVQETSDGLEQNQRSAESRVAQLVLMEVSWEQDVVE